ncbi:tetratricopeptide repeat protein [Alphaproteobacteria bacterium]|nr:tetratricopeptide repeat protein [Alphaproteobacteria bacterium]
MKKNIKKSSYRRLLATTVLASVTILALSPAQSFAQGADEAEQFIEEFLEQTSSEPATTPTSPEQEQADTVKNNTEENVLLPVPAEELAPQADVSEIVPPAEDNVLQEFVPAKVTQDVQSPVQDDSFSIPEVPAIPVAVSEDEGLFYDSEAFVPTGQMATKGTIRKVSPRVEPGSRYMVVTKKYAEGSHKAKLVSAQRALKLGRYESALEIYNELYGRNQRDESVLMGRAVALQKAGRTDAAVQAYEELLDVSPDNVAASVNMLGVVGRRYPAVALRRLLEIKKNNPGSVAVLAQLAVIEGNVGRYDEALKYLGIASGLEPRNANHLYNMAVIADRAGDKSTAVGYYEQALEIDSVHGGNRSVPRESIFARLSQIR